jgi:tRNA(Arg) A34 adenosine deaminase TadA
MKKQRLIHVCFEQSLKSNLHFNHGAVATAGGKIIATGFNQSHAKFFPSLHAEVHCINNVQRIGLRLKKIRIYVARFNKAGLPMFSKPCPNCEKTMRLHDVGQIFYFDKTGDWTLLEK